MIVLKVVESGGKCHEVVSVKNKLDSLFFTRLFASERKQIALIRHEKLFEISRAVLRDKSLRKEG